MCLLWPLRELSEPSHKNRLDSVSQGPGAIVTYLVLPEVKLGDRLAGLVVFRAMVIVLETRRPDDCTEEEGRVLGTPN